jgi:predicted secreted protein
MSIGAAVAIYFIIWWLCLFAVLPFGVRSQVEAGNVVPGSDRGAPVHHRMMRNVLWTTVVASIIFALYYANFVGGYVTLDDIPFLPRSPQD